MPANKSRVTAVAAAILICGGVVAAADKPTDAQVAADSAPPRFATETEGGTPLAHEHPPGETCLFPPGLEPPIFTDSLDDPAAAGGLETYRIVIRFVVVRRSDGTGGMDESMLHYFMRDLNYGFRDTQFVYVQHPEVLYKDDDTLFQNVDDWDAAFGLMFEFAEPGVAVNVITPSIFNDPFITGLNFAFNPRGNIMATHRIGNPDSIVYPPHEMGHVFWLYHPFETQFGSECTDGSNCLLQGDLVCDTPASPVVHGGNTTATGIFYAEIPGPCDGDPLYAPRTDLYMEAGWPAGHILRDAFTVKQTGRMVGILFDFSADLIGPERPDVLMDCDGNGVDDVDEILAGEIVDLNRDLVPDACQIFPEPGDLLVCGMTDDDLNRVRFFDGETGDFRETMWNGMPWVHQLRMGPDGLVYLATLTVVQRLDLATGRTRDNFLDGVLNGASTFEDLLFDANGDLLVLDNWIKNIQRYDGETGEFLGVFTDIAATGMTSPKYMEYGPDGNIYVVGNSLLGNTIQRFDRETGESLGSFIEPGAGGLIAGQGLIFHTDGRLYVSNAGGNNVLAFDAQTGAFIEKFVSNDDGGLSNPHSLRFGPDGHLYVASRGDASVKKYDGETGESLGDFVIPGANGLVQPTGILFVPGGDAIVGDIDGDGMVGPADLILLLGAWGPCDDCGACPADLDDDCAVSTSDLIVLLGNWSS